VPSRILIVEDDNVQADILAAFLATQDYYVETAADGLAAIDKARLGWFDIVLMDYRLGELDGVATARLIRSITRFGCSPKVIAITATPELVTARDTSGEPVFAAVIGKPWTRRGLRETIEAVRGAVKEDEDVSRFWPNWRQRIFPQEMKSGAHGPRLLVVDDDAVVLDAVRARLCRVWSEVDTAASGITAFEMIDSRCYDVVVMDYALPDVNGLTMARLVHDLVPKPRRPRMIALTATPGRVHQQEIGALSAFDAIVGKGEAFDTVVTAIEASIHYKSHLSVATVIYPADVAMTEPPDRFRIS